MAFTLHYRRGSFPQSASYLTLAEAVEEAYAVLLSTDCRHPEIFEGERLVMNQTQIEMQWRASGR